MADEEFGITEWGADWVHAAQAKMSANSRLPKARSLARNDRVQFDDLTAGPIEARVDDERVTITLPTYTAAQLKRVERLLTTDPDAGTQAPGDLSESVYIALANADLEPVPDSFESECTCGASAQPCVHKLATYYALSRVLDEQPQLALALRGRASAAAGSARGAEQRWIAITELSAEDYYRPRDT